MIFHITLINDAGFMQEHSLDLPCTDEARYEDFIQLESVRDLLLMHPTMRVQDVTPDGMPDWFSDAEQQSRQLANMGLKKTQALGHAPEYEDIE
jgi:hypothetical protein